jgi:hypothetical protein
MRRLSPTSIMNLSIRVTPTPKWRIEDIFCVNMENCGPDSTSYDVMIFGNLMENQYFLGSIDAYMHVVRQETMRPAHW